MRQTAKQRPISPTTAVRRRRRRRHHLFSCLRTTRSTNFILVAYLLLLTVSTHIKPINSSAYPTTAGGGIIIRVRQIDGSISRVQVPNGKENSTTIESILSSGGEAKSDGGDEKCFIGSGGTNGSKEIVDKSQTISELKLRNGSLLTILPPPRSKNEGGKDDAAAPSSSKSNKASSKGAEEPRYDPFPDLAKSSSYTQTLRRTRALSRGTKRGMSYNDITKIQSSLHIIEPQPTGPMKRLYMCRICAERFQANCIVTPTKKQRKEGITQSVIQNRVGLLFGTVNTERVDQKPNLVRTSLSTPLSERKMCDVGKVHAIWEPPNQNPFTGEQKYDAKELLLYPNNSLAMKRALRIATNLGLRPLGWLYSYSTDRHSQDDDALPVYGMDLVTASKLQIETMKLLNREEGTKFVTLALDARTGATEAFSVSDVCVQMVAEGVLAMPPSSPDNVNNNNKKKKKSKSTISNDEAKWLEGGRYITTTDPILIDSKETTKLDCVLCLVNMALLSHVGTYAGPPSGPAASSSSIKKNGSLTNKAKKRLIDALNQSENDDEQKNCNVLLEVLSDFNLLYGLDQLMGSEKEMNDICFLVRKWSRGQRKGTIVNKDLRLVLRSVLGC